MLDFCVLLFLFVKTGKKFQSACVVFCMNNMLFLRKDDDMSMHAVILYHADLKLKYREIACFVFLVMNVDRKFCLNV